MQEGDLINFLDSSAQPLTHRVKSFIESALNRMSKETLDEIQIKGRTNLITEKRPLTYSDVDNAYLQAVIDLENNIKKFNDEE
jgi:hypothetical protein